MVTKGAVDHSRGKLTIPSLFLRYMPEGMSDLSERMTDRMPGDMPERMICQKKCHKMLEFVPCAKTAAVV